jgi:hypothetical protein
VNDQEWFPLTERQPFRLAAHTLSPHCTVMLRPDKKYSVYDLRQLKGKRCLTHVHVKSPEEAAAAEAAGIDLLRCSFDSPASQARLPLLLQDERIAAFAEYADDVKSGRFPDASHLVAMDEAAFKEAVQALEGSGHA